MRKLVITILMVAYATINTLFGQEIENAKRVQGISIGYNTGYSYFFDNKDRFTDFLGQDHLFVIPVENFCLVGQVSLTNSAYYFQFNHINTRYPSELYKTPIGDIKTRFAYIYELGYKINILNMQSSIISFKAGVVARFGNENMIAGYYRGWETQVAYFEHRDLGLSFGLDYDQRIYKHLNFNAFTDMTYFAYRYHDGTRTNYSWDNGTTKWMYRLMIGLSYDVWTRKSSQKN